MGTDNRDIQRGSFDMKIVGEVVHRGCHNTTEEEHNQIARQDVE